jgi:hypothetical protein
MFIPDERARWFAVGIITAVALAFVNEWVAVAAGIILVRWVPWHDVVVWRELIVLGGVALAAGAAALRDTEARPSLIPIAIAAVTPAFPVKGLLFPYIVAGCMMLPAPFRLLASALFLGAIPFARYSFAPMLVVAAASCAWPLLRRLPAIPQTAVVALLALWPWSGAVARSLPALLRGVPRAAERTSIWQAAAVPASVSVDVPEGTRTITLTASAGDAMHLWPGSVLGRVELIDSSGRARTREIGIGDVADFGFMRREHFMTSHNGVPRLPVTDLRGFGASSWLYGAGRIILPSRRDVREMRVIPMRPGITIQVESVESR